MAKIRRVRWTRQALADMDNAYDCIAQERPSAVLGVIQQVQRALDALILYPMIGRPGRITGTRELYMANTPFLMAYRVNKNEIEILAFMHASRQWPESFEKV